MSLKNLKKAYDEACGCGYNGTFTDYLISIKVDLSVLDIPEEKK